MQCQRTLDDLSFVADARHVQTGTRPGQMHHRAIEQGTSQCTGCRGVADAHFAADKQLRPGCDGALHAVTTGL
ncbi:hypothetical protein D3C80_2166360 [compost metagenome]